MATTTTSITTTKTTTTTTTTPIKDVDNKSARTTNTTNTKTTTTTTSSTTTPIKEVCNKSTTANTSAPSTTTKKVPVDNSEKVKNLTWETDGPIQAQLCRDTYFGRYNSQTKATEIHRDPSRNYSMYNIQSLRKKLKEVRLLVKALHIYGIWLGENPIFYEMCRFNVYPNKEERYGMEACYKSWENQKRHDCEEKREKHSGQRDGVPDFVPSKKHSASQLKDFKINKEYSPDGEEYSLEVELPNAPNSSERLKVQYKGLSPVKLSVLHKSDADCNPEVLFNDFAALSVGSSEKNS